MDSSWGVCPYCTRAEQGKKPDAASAAKPVEQAMANERQHTRVGSNVGPATERRTEMFSDPLPEQRAPRGVADNRKIVGVLVSYTWNPFGTLYEIRQGRNHLGAGDIRGEDRQVDVHCPDDSIMSADHAMILVQGTEFAIQDLASVNGTFVNGKQLHPGSFQSLPSPSEIRAGETVFTFVRFDVSAGAAQVHVAAPQPQAEEKPPVRRPTELK
jgi:hypothetical protein